MRSIKLHSIIMTLLCSYFDMGLCLATSLNLMFNIPAVHAFYSREKRNMYACSLLLKIRNTPNFAHITTQYCPKLFISGVIKKKKRSTARSNLRLLSFNNPEYRPLQACFNVKMLSLLIFLTTCTCALGCDWTLNGQYFTYIRRYPHCTHQCLRVC